jgi:DNA-binding HxlR family transcriptional regulator
MYERKIQPTLNCGLDMVGEVLYGKWKPRLLWFINQGFQRPSELARKIPDASRRVLHMQLNELEEHEFDFKVCIPASPAESRICAYCVWRIAYPGYCCSRELG